MTTTHSLPEIMLPLSSRLSPPLSSMAKGADMSTLLHMISLPSAPLVNMLRTMLSSILNLSPFYSSLWPAAEDFFDVHFCQHAPSVIMLYFFLSSYDIKEKGIPLGALAYCFLAMLVLGKFRLSSLLPKMMSSTPQWWSSSSLSSCEHPSPFQFSSWSIFTNMRSILTIIDWFGCTLFSIFSIIFYHSKVEIFILFLSNCMLWLQSCHFLVGVHSCQR